LTKREALRIQLTNELATLLHDEWRAPRRIKDENGNDTGRYEERIKVLVIKPNGEEKWYNKGDEIPEGSKIIKEQDIANTSYQDLDPSWQADNKAAAEVAMGEVFKALKAGKSLDDPTFIEEASAVIHDEWLKRNGWRATEVQKLPYEKLPE